MAGPHRLRSNPAFYRAGITFNRFRRHGRLALDGIEFTNTLADTAVSAPVVIDDGLFLYQLDRVNRAVSDTVATGSTFFRIYFHNGYQLVLILRCTEYWNDILLEQWDLRSPGR